MTDSLNFVHLIQLQARKRELSQTWRGRLSREFRDTCRTLKLVEKRRDEANAESLRRIATRENLLQLELPEGFERYLEVKAVEEQNLVTGPLDPVPLQVIHYAPPRSLGRKLATYVLGVLVAVLIAAVGGFFGNIGTDFFHASLQPKVPSANVPSTLP